MSRYRDEDDDFDPWAPDPPETPPSSTPQPSWGPAPQPPPGYQYVLNPDTKEWVLLPQGSQLPWLPNKQPTAVDERSGGPTYTPTGTGGGGGDIYGGGVPMRSGLSRITDTYPNFQGPRFEAPAPFAFDPFSYEDFQAPTLAEAQGEPGFEYALNQGIKAFENSKAYLGTYRTGGTIKGLNDYARNMANQNYNEVFRRKGETYDRNRGNAFQNWQGNRENAADAYATNYGISRDVFDRNYTAAKDEYAPKARAAELQFGRDWDVYAYEGDDAYRRWKALVDANAV